MKPTEEDIRRIRELNDQHFADAYPYFFVRDSEHAPAAFKGCRFYYCGDEALHHHFNLDEGLRFAILPWEAERYAAQNGITYDEIRKNFAAVMVAVFRESDLIQRDSENDIDFLPLPADFAKKIGLSSDKPSRTQIYEFCKDPENRKYYSLLIAPYMYNKGQEFKFQCFVDHTGKDLYYMVNN